MSKMPNPKTLVFCLLGFVVVLAILSTAASQSGKLSAETANYLFSLSKLSDCTKPKENEMAIGVIFFKYLQDFIDTLDYPIISDVCQTKNNIGIGNVRDAYVIEDALGKVRKILFENSNAKEDVEKILEKGWTSEKKEMNNMKVEEVFIYNLLGVQYDSYFYHLLDLLNNIFLPKTPQADEQIKKLREKFGNREIFVRVFQKFRRMEISDVLYAEIYLI